MIVAVDNPSLANSTEVSPGSTVNAIFLRAEVLATGVYSGVPRVYMIVFKDPGDNLGTPNPNSVGPDDRKKFVLHQEMTMVHNPGSDGAGFPRTMFQGVVRLPPRLKRFGFNDRLEVNFQNGVGETTGIANVCVQVIYKEFK